MKSILIKRILKADLCCGCGLCESLTDGKLKMRVGRFGFLRPIEVGEPTQEQIDEIEKVCPGLSIRREEESVKVHPLWGPVIKVRVGWATDKEMRYIGSSGGALSAVLTYLLDFKIVNFIMHIGPSESNPLLNEVKISRTREDLLRNAGSRYSPSSPLVLVKQLLRGSETFAVVGKPCDIAGLRSYARRNPEVDKKIKYLFSFMCAGIPSLKGTMEILKHLGVHAEEVASIRYRGEGWPGKTKVILKSGKVLSMSYSESWGTILGKQLQFRCKICADGTGEFADVSFGDAWYGGEDGFPDFQEREGRSLIISRTERGEGLIHQCLDQRTIEANPISITEVEKMQPYQANRKKQLLARILAMKLMGLKTPHYTNLGLRKAAKLGGLRQNFRAFIGAFRRAAAERVRQGKGG